MIPVHKINVNNKNENINPIRIIFDSLISSFIAFFISFFVGIPIILYYVLQYIIEYVFEVDSTISITCTIFSMVVLYLIISIYFAIDITKSKTEKSLESVKNEIANIKKNTEEEIALLKTKEKKLIDDINYKTNNIDALINEQQQTYPWLANIFADYFYLQDLEEAKFLKTKPRPALKAAQQVSTIAKEKRDLQKLCKLYEYQLNYYETVFPQLEEFKLIGAKDGLNIINSIDDEYKDEYESVKNWLSPSEYSKLSSAEKWQIALDRYINRKNKNNWDIGIEYERYIGYIFETKGYTVKYFGATEGLNDLGRDLIVSKDNKNIVIQCKRWSKDKTIHEKHIFQLYGTTVLLKLQNPNKKFSGMFFTTASLSDTAKEIANYLKITVKENDTLQDYPLIKCNNGKNKEKIYHLPFDQKYDIVQIAESDGDLYVSTVEKAESLGYRHAYRWSGNN